MTLVNLKLRNTNLSLDCDDKDRIDSLAAKYNHRLEELAAKFPGASDLKLALIAGLMVEDQVEALIRKIESDVESQKGEVGAAKKNLTDTISQIADYIEHLASRVEKS
ncbi:MAG: cell division protein ZapA [Candidatus Jidaibacter sp.]|jgi:cell division protein ZapA (FtsZ GTPase activity inhibitor)|nr:cell division protein ZapA [Candidatus Jidaibacter sp.]